MKYIQLPFKFILYNTNQIVRQNLFLSISDYSLFIQNFNKVITPSPEPDFSFDNYSATIENWRIECLKDLKYRSELREEIISELIKINKTLIDTKLNHRADFLSRDIYEYKFYHKELIENWIEIWKNVELEIESLETLLIFKKFLHRSCLNEKKVEADERRRIEKQKEFIRDSIEEERYWNNNYYEEGGGGQDWSDPFD